MVKPDYTFFHHSALTYWNITNLPWPAAPKYLGGPLGFEPSIHRMWVNHPTSISREIIAEAYVGVEYVHIAVATMCVVRAISIFRVDMAAWEGLRGGDQDCHHCYCENGGE